MSGETTKRKHIRFEADPNQIAWISLDTKNFKKDYICLLHQESYGGCQVITNQAIQLRTGEPMLIKVGEIGPLLGEVRWLKEVSEHVFVMGIEFKE